jgi:AraC-like DNA-binding protein
MQNHQDSQVTFVRAPDLPQVEARFSRYRRRVSRKHTHDAYAIGLVRQGVTDFWCSGGTVAIGPGDIALINPEQVHACNPRPGCALAYWMFYVEPGLMHEVACDVLGDDRGCPRFARPVVRDPQLWQGFADLYILMSSPSDRLEKQVCLYDTLSRLVSLHAARRAAAASPDDTSERMQVAQMYLLENVTHNVSLEELSAHVNLSPYHFLRRFRAAFGMPPHTYRLQQRIHLAKRMLAAGIPIAQVALDTGFTDQSHFTKRFRTFVGTTPGQYQTASQ